MPIYEYECGCCDARFEKLVRSLGGREKACCPTCGSEQTRRAMSVFAVSGESNSKGASEIPAMCGRIDGTCPCAGIK